MKWFPLLLGLLLMGLSTEAVMAQSKTERLENYLGAYRFENDRPLGTVKFVFQRAVLTREGNGKKSYKSLLIGQKGFTNLDNAGNLLTVQVVYKGEVATIHPEPKGRHSASKAKQKAAAKTPTATEAPQELVRTTRRRSEPRVVPAQLINEAPVVPEPSAMAGDPEPKPTSPDPIRPRPLFPEDANKTAAQNNGIQLPDSITIAQNLNEAKHTITGWKGRLWQSAQPIWEFVMWIFNSVLVLLICFGGLFRYVAKTAAAESKVNRKGRVVFGRWIVGAHQNASAILLIITWVIAVVLLMDVFMWLVYLDLPVWLLVVIWFPILWLAEKITDWIVPNLRGDEGML